MVGATMISTGFWAGPSSVLGLRCNGVVAGKLDNLPHRTRCGSTPGKPAPFMSAEPFHGCTHTALSPKGEIYVSDGYGNASVQK
jgi:hypothetical protein